MEQIAANRSFGGDHQRWRHRSAVLDCDMVFAVFLPPGASAEHPAPALYWLSGLTCTDENFMQKAGAQRLAAQLGMAIIAPDTSPRGPGVPGDPDNAWDFGHGAGFYVNAAQEPWAHHYRMHDYVVHELPALIEAHFPVTGCRGISGHSMGGHGALICALRNPGRYVSVSAFSPIVNPSTCPWGQKAFSRYLGDDAAVWAEWDAAALIAHAQERLPILIDQGDADSFLNSQLRPEILQNVALAVHHPLILRLQPGYDHSYFFIAGFIDDHLRHHAKAMLPDRHS